MKGLLFACWGSLFLSSAVWAGDPKLDAVEQQMFLERQARETREHYEDAVAQYNLQHFDTARQMFERAYADKHDPQFLYNIAQCWRNMGITEAALRSYRAYLQMAPGADNADEVRTRITELEQAAARKRDAVARPLSAPAVVEAPDRAPSPTRRVHRQTWWIWTTAAFVLSGAAVGVGVGVWKLNQTPTATTTLGTARWP